jgi:hypothetical protein
MDKLSKSPVIFAAVGIQVAVYRAYDERTNFWSRGNAFHSGRIS